MTVDRDGKLTLSYTETNAEAKKRLYAKVKSMLGKLDMNPGHLIHRFAYMKNDIPVAGCAHQAGTCRFGTEPATSVLNTDCRAHELDNLYVVDTSVFPSIGAVNPALTAMANSLRVGDHLLERMAWRAKARARLASTASHPADAGVELDAAGDHRRRLPGEQIELGRPAGGRRRGRRRAARVPPGGARLLDGYGATRCARRAAGRC